MSSCMTSIEPNARVEEYKALRRQNRTPTPTLISQALEASQFEESPDSEACDRYWEPIRTLHCRADDEVVNSAAELLLSPSADSRALGANILAQVQIGDATKGQAAAELLAAALAREREDSVLEALLFALGHTPNLTACARFRELLAHPSADVRHALAYALPMHDEDPGTIPALITLSADADADVRDWATFGLGTLIEADSPDIRTALVHLLDDPEGDARGEALVGLARRGDTRLIPAFLRELEATCQDEEEPWDFLADAAEVCVAAAKRTGDPLWLPLLARLDALKNIDRARLGLAISHCAALCPPGAAAPRA